MKKTLFAFAAAIGMAVCSNASADLVVEYDGTAGISKSAINGIHSTGISLTRGGGIDSATGTNFNSTNFSSADLASAIAADEYLSFGFTVNAGQSLNMTDILVEMDRSGSGPDTVYLLFDANGDGFDAGDLLSSQAIPDPGSILTFNTGLPVNLTNADGLAEFRFYYSGIVPIAGTSDIEDDLIGGSTGNVGLQLNGSFSAAIPEPSSILIVVGLACGMLARRRR